MNVDVPRTEVNLVCHFPGAAHPVFCGRISHWPEEHQARLASQHSESRLPSILAAGEDVGSEDVASGPRVCLYFNWASSPTPSLKNDFYNHFHLEKIKYFLMAWGGSFIKKE